MNAVMVYQYPGSQGEDYGGNANSKWDLKAARDAQVEDENGNKPDMIDYFPENPGEFMVFVDGVLQAYGATKDFTFTAQNASTDCTITFTKPIGAGSTVQFRI